MLNPESVDYNAGKVRLLFTDENGDQLIKIYLDEMDAWRLHQMIQHACNMISKKDRPVDSEKYDHNF